MNEQWFIAIGTVILALIALFQDFIRTWLKTPKLEVSTSNCAPFCKKLLFVDKKDSEKRASGYALRIRVKNTNPFFRIKSRAECVEIFALQLQKKQSDSCFQPVQNFESRNLIWSNSFSPFSDISPAMERYCFIGRVVDPRFRDNFPGFDLQTCNMSETCLRIDVDMPRNTKDHIIPPGTYRIECLIGAANVKAFKKTFEIYLSGEWFENEIEMYEKALKIRML